ncbi:MAG: hypothetical protein ACRC1K_02365, partial [Planctomycetia bacterium]
VDVTPLARDWLAKRRPNHGVALTPLVDRAVDDGNNTRFQIYASEDRAPARQPRLKIWTKE